MNNKHHKLNLLVRLFDCTDKTAAAIVRSRSIRNIFKLVFSFHRNLYAADY